MAKKSPGKKTSRKTAGKTSSRKSTSRARKTTAKASSASTSAGRRKTTKKAAGGGAKKKTKKKTAARKTRAGGTTRTTAAKGPSKKKTVAKKNVSKKTTTTKKKTTTRKKTAATKKKAVTKKSSKKKPAAKKVSAKKTAAKKTAAKKTSKKTAKAPPAAAEKKKRKRGSAGDTRRTGRSVAQAASVADADEKGYVFINGRRVRMITTSGKVPSKRTRTAAVAETSVDETPTVRKPVKTSLSRKQLNYYRNLLLIKRAELVGDLSSLEAEALRSSGGNLSHMPIHMADIGSDTYEQDFMLGLAEAERTLLREIDAALQRIQDGTYGVCQMTLEPIPEARLEAKPWAKYTIEAARRMERGWSA